MASQFPFMPEQASSLASEVDNLTLFLVGYASFFTIVIGLMVIVLAIRYRRRHADEVGGHFDNSHLLEIVWTVIPLLIVIVTFAWGAKVYFQLYRVLRGAAEYYATGKQWMWKTQQPTGQREINELHVPVGKAVKLVMASEDVLHSFYVPAFRVKADVVPGRYTSLWFQPTKPGRYHLFCAEYCGAEHSGMNGWVVVQPQDEYDAWLAGTPALAPAAAGEQLFAQYSCTTCHGERNGGRGPALAGLYGRTVALAGGGHAIADEAYLRESILNPAAKIVEGYESIMPSFQGQLSEESVLQLIAYIKSLNGGTPSPATAGHVAEGVAQ